MMDKTETPQWVKNVVHTCMGLQRGEKVLVVVDEPLGYARDLLLAEAAQTDPAELWSYTFPNASRPLDAYPSALLNLMTQADAIVLLLASMNPARELPAWNEGKAVIVKGTARAGIGAFIDQSILDLEMSADYEQIAAFTSSLAERLRGSSSARITTALGTDLRMSLEGREWRADTGILHGRGVFGNLPSGEIYIAPVEDSAEGVLVIDKCLPGMLLSEPARVVFEKGRVTQVDGGAGAEFLRNAFAQHGDAARVIAELGIGTNPKARLQGNIITDEKVLGTIHVAVGRNDFLGGKNVATTHIDGVVGQPTLEIDGRVVIENGKHL
ncbi:MAG: aminopeptidase [Anaerolineales bacterium]|nr:aminopeptidase [Anaerolineales bacterium]